MLITSVLSEAQLVGSDRGAAIYAPHIYRRVLGKGVTKVIRQQVNRSEFDSCKHMYNTDPFKDVVLGKNLKALKK